MARKKFFLPKGDIELISWLNAFSSKISAYAAKYNLTPQEVMKVQKGAAFLVYWITTASQMKATAQKITAYKNEVRDGHKNNAVSVAPTDITFSPPEDAGPGVVPFVLKIAGRIKKHQAYSIADGKNLGLEGTEQLPDLVAAVPAFKIKLHNGHPKLIWKKGIFDGVKIKVNRQYNLQASPSGNSGFELLAIDMQPDFIDVHPLPVFGQSAVWAYVMIYIKGDKEVGNWSGEQMITVTGMQ